jgi:hypothetical protein
VHTINPLALSVDELYGSFDAATHEWRDGVLAKTMRAICRRAHLAQARVVASVGLWTPRPPCHRYIGTLP